MKRIKIHKIITTIELVLFIGLAIWFCASMHEVQIHNHYALYGIDHAYSNWNLFTIIFGLNK
jgi:hypothetical protein